MRFPKLVAPTLSIIMLAAVGCSESTPKAIPNATTTTLSKEVVDCSKSASIVECAPKGTSIADVLPKLPKKATGTPIVIGTINQDTGAAGAFPELTVADKVAVAFINEELNGVDGHPIELITCNTQFNPDLSQSCAQQMVSRHAVAVIGGIDIWGTGIKTLDNNGIPLIGGIPVSFDSVRAKTSFQFSGGTWGAAVGMAQYAIDTLHKKRLAIIYGDFGPIADAAKLAERAIKQHGGTPILIPTPVLGADMSQFVNQAAATKPDAVLALTADSGCVPTLKTAQQIGLNVPIMLTGACAAPNIIAQVGDSINGKIFNLEADLTPNNPDSVLYQAVSKRYGPRFHYEAQGAGTVSFRATINLYAILRKVGGDKVTKDSIVAAFRATKNQPSFFGHPYTCDGKQLAGYPAMCSPQQTLGEWQKGTIKQISPWLDIAAWLKG